MPEKTFVMTNEKIESGRKSEKTCGFGDHKFIPLVYTRQRIVDILTILPSPLIRIIQRIAEVF